MAKTWTDTSRVETADLQRWEDGYDNSVAQQAVLNLKANATDVATSLATKQNTLSAGQLSNIARVADIEVYKHTGTSENPIPLDSLVQPGIHMCYGKVTGISLAPMYMLEVLEVSGDYGSEYTQTIKFERYTIKRSWGVIQTSPTVVQAWSAWVYQDNVNDKANLSYVDASLGTKQTKSDNTLTTTSKIIVGAINENKTNIDLRQTKTITDTAGRFTTDTVEGALAELGADTGLMATNLVTNGDFSNGTTGWIANASTISVENNTLSVIGNGVSSNFSASQAFLPTTYSGEKHYFRCKASIPTGCISFSIYTYNGTTLRQVASIVPSSFDTFISFSGIATQSDTGTTVLYLFIKCYFADAASASGKTMKVQYVSAINPTATFGAGNEPSAGHMDTLLSGFANSWFSGTKNLFGASTTIKKLATLESKGKILSDTTYNTAAITGTWTADSATDTLTCSAAHGLVVGDSVMFNSGTGVIPTGLVAEPEFYYVIAVPTTTTLQVSLLRNGTALDITANGTTGWTIKKAKLAAQIISLDFSNYSYNDIYATISCAPVSSLGNSAIYFSAVPVSCKLFLNNSAIYGNAAGGYVSGTMTKKYVQLTVRMSIRKIATSYYYTDISVCGINSDNLDLSSGTAITNVFSGTITGADLTGLTFYDGLTSTLRSGARFIVVGR